MSPFSPGRLSHLSLTGNHSSPPSLPPVSLRAQEELNRPLSPRSTPRAFANAKHGTTTATKRTTTALRFPPVAPELQNLIISFVPPSKLWTQFRRVCTSYKYTIEEILAPRWLQEGHLSLYLQLDDITMKDYKSMLFNGMAYGPDLKGPYCLDKLKDWDGKSTLAGHSCALCVLDEYHSFHCR